MTDKDDRPPASESAPAPRKPFVEPTISDPLDVLEATTFFLAPSGVVTDGVIN